MKQRLRRLFTQNLDYRTGSYLTGHSALQRGQNVQTVVIAAIREFLLRKPQIDEKTKQQIIASALAIN